MEWAMHLLEFCVHSGSCAPRLGALARARRYGRDGAAIRYKAWVCSNPEGGFTIRIDNGELTLGRTIGPSYK